jgi:hypothetical protein
MSPTPGSRRTVPRVHSQQERGSASRAHIGNQLPCGKSLQEIRVKAISGVACPPRHSVPHCKDSRSASRKTATAGGLSHIAMGRTVPAIVLSVPSGVCDLDHTAYYRMSVDRCSSLLIIKDPPTSCPSRPTPN